MIDPVFANFNTYPALKSVMPSFYRCLFVCVIAVLSTSRLVFADTVTMSIRQQQQLGVKTQQPELSTQSSYLGLPARVVVPPDQLYLVSAAQNGIISKVYVGEGASVVDNQLLLTMSSPDLLDLQHAYLQARSQLQIELNKQKRLKPLWKDGIISERRWLELASTVQLARSTVQQQSSLLQLAGMSKPQLDALRTRHRLLQSLSVNAPAKGVILKRLVVPGQRVETMTPLFQLADLSSLWLEISVPVQHIGRVSLDDQITIEDLAVQARVILLSRKVDSDNQTVLVRALIDDPPQQLRVDQLVNVVFVRSTQSPVYRIPVAAVVRQDGQRYVFVANDHGFEVRRIDMTVAERGFVMVTSGLSEHERIAVNGVAVLKAAWNNSGDDD